MIVLDENIDERVRERLADWGIRCRQVGREVGRKGIADREVIQRLHRLDHPTLFTRDRDFNNPKLCHRGYCVVLIEN